MLSIKQMCEWAEVSRSGYYNWINNTRINRARKHTQDTEDYALIKAAFDMMGEDKGARMIHMLLLQWGYLMNLKKVRRLMKKYGLECGIRKRKAYRIKQKSELSKRIQPNFVRRQFKAYGPRCVLLTDITYCIYGRNKTAYLCTIKDAYTNEILSYTVSESLEMRFVLECVENLVENHGIYLHDKTLIHSDQGSHFTSISFQNLLKKHSIIQSMSRRGNCWDNAPQESFFGHMKDAINFALMDTFEQVKTAIDAYMEYYNNDRPQWNLAKLPPTQYYQYYQTGVYPYGDLITPPAFPEVRQLEIIEEPSE